MGRGKKTVGNCDRSREAADGLDCDREGKVTIEELKRRTEVQQAFLDGKAVQYLPYLGDRKWHDLKCCSPGHIVWEWCFNDYRVKPEPKVFFVAEYQSGLSDGHLDKPEPWSSVVRWHRFVEDVDYQEK